MNNWSLDIKMQTGWDLWLLVCVVASLVLLSYAVFTKPWRRASGWVSMPLIGIGLGGTGLMLLFPRLHADPPYAGMVWTFLLLVILSAVFYLNLRAHLGTGRTGVLFAMRTLALGLMVPMLFDPVLSYLWRPKPERPIVFVIDTSGSMSVPDKQNGPTRIQSVWRALQPQVGAIGGHFVPSYYTFSSGLDQLKSPEDIGRAVANGSSTDVVGAMNKAFAKVPANDAIFILLSDGIDNTSPNVANALGAMRRPIHTVRVGSDQAQAVTLVNVAVDNVDAPDDVIVGHEAKIKINVKSSALPNRVVELKLAEIKEGDKLGAIQSQTLVLQPLAEGQTVELPFAADSVGVHRLKAWIDKIPGERTDADNAQQCEVLAIDPRIRVLYVEGRLRPEYKPLTLALSRDRMIELATLLRTTEKTFQASGRVNGEPLVRMPASLAEWKKFDVLILGDLDASFLPADQQRSIEQFVKDGGGLLMLGGENSFGPGGYKGTPIEACLPVFVGDINSPQEKAEFVPRLTAEGAKDPAMGGLAEWFGVEDVQKPTKELPALRGNVVVEKVKSGAEVWLYHPGRPGPDGKPQVILATMIYGRRDTADEKGTAALGRTAAFTADTTNLWYLPLRGLGQDSPFNKFWGQLVRWLARADVRNRARGAGVDALLNKNTYMLGDAVRVRAFVRDLRGDATEFAQVSLTLRKAGAKEGKQIPVSKVPTRIGMYETNLADLDKGDWVIELSASKDGKPLSEKGEKKELKFTITPPVDEMLKVAANSQLLADIAKKTKGYNYDLADFGTLLEKLIKESPSAVTERQENVRLSNVFRLAAAATVGNPTWNKDYDLPMQAGVVFVLLAGEWILRRRWQLP